MARKSIIRSVAQTSVAFLIIALWSGAPARAASPHPLAPTALTQPTYTFARSFLPNLGGANTSGGAVAIADVTGEGRPDVLVVLTARGFVPEVWVMAQKPSGALAPGRGYQILPTSDYFNPHRLAVGDINGDGRNDVAVSATDGVAIFYQQTDGTLGPESLVPTINLDKLVITDWSGDGDADILALRLYPSGNEIHLLEQGPAGHFTDSVLVAGDMWDFAVGRLNAGPRPDIVTTGPSGTAVLLQQADHSVDGTTIPINGATVLATDTNGDGIIDIVLGGPALLYGNGDGTFQDPVTPPLGYQPRITGIGVADLNNDGRVDLYGHTLDDFMAFWLQNPDGSFQPPCTSDTLDANGLFATGDINGDGKTDIAFGSASIGFLLGASKADAQIGMFDPTVTTVDWGSYVSYSGYLSPLDGCPNSLREGETIELLRSLNGGPNEVVGTDTTDTTGRVTIEDRPPTIGSYEYRLRWNGDAIHNVVTTDPASLQVVQGDDILQFTPASAEGIFGHSIDYTVKLDPYAVTSNLEVQVFAQPFGQSETLIKDALVDPDTGTLTGRYQDLRRETTFRVAWAGDGTWNPSETTFTLPVDVSVTGDLVKFDHKEGHYRVYNVGKNVYYVVRVAPNETGEKVVVSVQVHRRGRWRGWASQGFILGRHSKLLIYIPGDAIKRRTGYRIRTDFNKGDATRHLVSGGTGYSYFKAE